MQVVFANDHGPGRAKSPPDVGVLVGDVVQKQRAGRGGWFAGKVNQVFDCDGNAMQWAAQLAADDFLFREPRLCDGFVGIDADEGVDNSVVLLDARETLVDEFNRRQLPSL